MLWSLGLRRSKYNLSHQTFRNFSWNISECFPTTIQVSKASALALLLTKRTIWIKAILKRTTSTRGYSLLWIFNFAEQIQVKQYSPSVAKTRWVPSQHKQSMVLPSGVQNCLQRDDTSSHIHWQRGLTQNLQFVMNMDYKLEPITDKYATNLVRNAFTRFWPSNQIKERLRTGALHNLTILLWRKYSCNVTELYQY